MFNKNKFAQLVIKAKGKRSINEYGNQSGISPAHISRLSRSLLKSPPNPQTIKKLADYVHNEVSYDDLMEAAGYLQIKETSAPPDNHKKEYIITGTGNEDFRFDKDIPQEVREEIINNAEYLIKKHKEENK